MTVKDAIKKMQAVKAYMISGNPIWSVTEMGEAFDMAIEALKQNQWIPCEERLPGFYEPVLTWDGRAYSVEKRLPYICDDDGEHIISDWWVSDDYDESESDYYPNLRDGAAIAWMPKPKAYEGRSE